MDPLSQLFTLLKPAATISSGFDAGGDWAIAFDDQRKQIKCYAISSGQCWLAVEGVESPVLLQAGDCFVLPRGRPFRLASNLALTPIPASTIFPGARDGGMVTVNGGGSFSLIGSRFAVRGNQSAMLLGLLPPIVHLRGEKEREAIRWSVDRMMQELRDAQPGGDLIAQHLAHMMLIQALRVRLAEGVGKGAGWFFALADPRLNGAISAIHDEPDRRWTLKELAERAGMSRSLFAQRFREIVGETPMQYLTRWRMMLACDRLENEGASVSSVAIGTGYESESAFSTAFKRIVGCSPRDYCRMRPAMDAPSERKAYAGVLA
ncbi:AraC family transcriptional regulator [Stakelama sp. CBK3Z-3]|uniref:AraC family transcriptional regulator n=1 Tax=Stakelama flava TaxID=2860338 RepID=A0ABS6XIR9_9SPHN|nr:AraC family transcriptional regulator [Stakelama flava]MBW4330097.1 AraC family transcriptional regulator [Stakelama flava]